jgi:hypothetical protein
MGVSPVRALAIRLFRVLGIDPRGAAALLRALLVMDLRGQHYASATATRPQSIFSPLFLVAGQCLTVSALASLLLFARVGVFFFAFVSLTLSALLTMTMLLVEFHEVVLDHRDLERLGPCPITPRTYAAARLGNLLFSFTLMFLALNLIPTIVGAGLRDAGPWYAPAYLVAALAGNLLGTALVLLLLSLGGLAGRLEALKQLLAWTQIVLILVVFYYGQMVLRDSTHALQRWAARPPAWVGMLPTAWLARLVERAAVVRPDLAVLGGFAIAVAAALLGMGLALLRVAGLYRSLQPRARVASARPFPAVRLGSLAAPGLGWLFRTAEERIGGWLCWTFLRREPGLALRCLFAFNLVVAVMVLGVATGQFADPWVERDPAKITFPILAVYLVPLALPVVLFNLVFTRDSAGSWVLGGAPLARPSGLSRGVCKAVQLGVVTPCCVLLGIVSGSIWEDIPAALLHAGLAWMLAWPAALASLWLVVPALPFSAPPARGVSLALPPLPLAAFSLVAFSLAGVHYLFADRPMFWGASFAACLVAGAWLGRKADARLARVGGQE